MLTFNWPLTTTKRDSCQASIDLTKSELNFLERYQNRMSEYISELETSIVRKHDTLFTEYGFDADQIFPDFSELVRKHINALKTKLIGETQKIIKEKQSSLNNLTEYLNDIERQRQPLLLKIENQEALKPLESQLTEQQSLNETINNLREKQSIIERKIDVCLKELKDSYAKLMNLHNQIVKEFSKAEKSKLGSVNLRPILTFNKKQFSSYFTEMFNKVGGLNKRFSPEGSEKQIFDEESIYVFDESTHMEYIGYILDSLVSKPTNDLKPRQGFKRIEAIRRLLSNYFDVYYDLVKDGDNLETMSPGKRGLVLLQLFLGLSNETYPILIDQPEDNLDNRTISKELTEFLRERKRHRQIIIVTHNPNLVVLTDAEEVIVANQGESDNQEYLFEYVSGSLECTFSKDEIPGILQRKGIREHVCDILEGGREAFVLREQKYGFK